MRTNIETGRKRENKPDSYLFREKGRLLRLIFQSKVLCETADATFSARTTFSIMIFLAWKDRLLPLTAAPCLALGRDIWKHAELIRDCKKGTNGCPS